MSILTVGSVAYDDIITPFARRDRALGGSATYFALAAHHFSKIKLVAVVGDDFEYADQQLLGSKGVDLKGLERVSGKCFYWKGEYLANWNDRISHDTQLNVFEKFDPKIPLEYKDSEFVFLGNIHPSLQQKVLDQITKPKWVALDTMNLWIKETRSDLLATLKKVDLLLINDSEAMMLSGERNLFEAARTIAKMGPRTLCIKKGEHGALLFHGEQIFAAPAYPLCKVVDPTGAGDAFAGGFFGYLAAQNSNSFETLKKAVIYGSVMGSFTVESFSIDRVAALSDEDIRERYKMFVEITHFEN